MPPSPTPHPRRRRDLAPGAVLVAAVTAALVWANSPWSSSYGDVWTAALRLPIDGRRLPHDLRQWVNQGLMAGFFLFAGLELKRELVVGELRDRRRAALPVLAALGGMVLPALIFLALNPGGRAARGWAVPIATDIAFALGLASLLGRRVPATFRLFLLALAVADDIGALVVVATVYSAGIDGLRLVVGLALFVLLVVLAHRVPWPAAVLAVLGPAVWLAVTAAGVNGTLAGVAVGLATPVRGPGPGAGLAARLERRLDPWVSYAVLPVFVVANAGVALGGGALGRAATSPVTLRVVAAKLLGKPAGIVLAVVIARRLGLGALPRGMEGRHVVAAGAVAGVGFTVSLLFADLAFAGLRVEDDAKLGILAGSVLAAGLARAALAGRPRLAADASGVGAQGVGASRRWP